MRYQRYRKGDRGIPGTLGVTDPLAPIQFPSVDGDWFTRLLRSIGLARGNRCLVPTSFVDRFFACECGNLLVIVPGYPDFQRGFSVCRQCRRTWHVECEGERYLVEYLGPTTVGLGMTGVGGA